MKLKKVLLPEVFRGNRSSGLKIFDDMVKKTLEAIEFTPNGIEANCTPGTYLHSLLSDMNGRTAFALAKRHTLEKGETYYICKDFAEALDQMRDRDVVTDLLPEKFLAFVQFPAGMFKDAQGAYIYIGQADERTPVKPENRGHRMVSIAYMGEVDLIGMCPMGRFNFFLHDVDGKTVESLVGLYENDLSNPDTLERFRVAKLLLNIVLYLKSKDPEILELRPISRLSLSTQKKRMSETGGHGNLCSIPIKAINWDYTRIRETEESETFVNSFPRWQRCGPANSEIRLVWVSEHMRKYQKTNLGDM